MENNPENTFEYEPLSTEHAHPIRLLSLLPSSDFKAEIKCEIFNTSLEDKPIFEALSYTWGDPKDLIPILLHGRPHQIPRNLESALRHLRLPDRTRVLWVDAMCINQSDIPERNQQVSKRRDIYTMGGAQKVVVWLGRIKNAQLGLDFCAKLAEEQPAYARSSAFKVEWEACHDIFMRNPWWSRAWIVQEVVHTNEVVVHIGGSKSISIESLCEKFKAYESRSWIIRLFWDWTEEELQKDDKEAAIDPRLLEEEWYIQMIAVQHLNHATTKISNTRKDANLSPPERLFLPSLLCTFRDQKATDFHDKIYASQCMAFDTPARNDIPIDYKISKQKLYTIATRVFTREHIFPLLLVESNQKPVSSTSELASWVIDFEMTQNLSQRKHFSIFTFFDASKGFPPVEYEPRLFDSLDYTVLPLRGIYVATVTGVFETHITNHRDLVDLDSLKLIRYSEEPQHRNRDFVEDPPTPWQTHDQETGSAIISQGNTSWGPIYSDVGDIIVVVAGFELPVVLRMFQKEKYLFVGACLLIEREMEKFSTYKSDPAFSDIMHGRACEGLPDDYEAEIFDIY
ncbi:hypothetical protein HYALB_00003285 [Hymenoscyphus albidus]|uniref:Heterokaryon incompatibility domain-containing protein n=1 Tax=Hymenoscyphus albidus TaxID=595503 RepID=A0A9N9LGK9_9HELO|nr:hypothetical protein HYALB_00003285 [Hymenoscyphus albidus]